MSVGVSFSRLIYFFVSAYVGGIILAASTPRLIGVRDWFLLPPSLGMSMVVLVVSLVLCIQGIYTLIWMLNAWEDPAKTDEFRSPAVFTTPKFSFVALIPARHEKKVIGDTIRAVSDINYPEELKEVIVLCRSDDKETIREVNKTIDSLNKKNIQLLVFDGFPINKPHSLNIGLGKVLNRSITNFDTNDLQSRNIYNNNQTITIFDAEDQPHRDIYNVVNTIMSSETVDVVQSGVQLMNYRSHWFSSINVLEYYFWFKSGLNFFSRVGNVTPLGGNTVFIKKDYLDKIGGWDENCLTEDADLGIRLANQGAKVRIVYDEQHVTREETPDSVESFVKQRTRWNHGFLQILMKGDWKNLPQIRQKIVALYSLVAPTMQMGYLFYLPIGLWIAFHFKLPVGISIISFIPTYVFLIQIAVYLTGIREFTKTYNFKYSLWDSIKILIVFIPYQGLLTIASARAVLRILNNQNLWEKTNHNNAHRQLPERLSPAYAYATNSV